MRKSPKYTISAATPSRSISSRRMSQIPHTPPTLGAVQPVTVEDVAVLRGQRHVVEHPQHLVRQLVLADELRQVLVVLSLEILRPELRRHGRVPIGRNDDYRIHGRTPFDDADQLAPEPTRTACAWAPSTFLGVRHTPLGKGRAYDAHPSTVRSASHWRNPSASGLPSIGVDTHKPQRRWNLYGWKMVSNGSCPSCLSRYSPSAWIQATNPGTLLLTSDHPLNNDAVPCTAKSGMTIRTHRDPLDPGAID